MNQNFFSKRNIFLIIITIFILITIPVAFYLSQKTQIFKPRASEVQPSPSPSTIPGLHTPLPITPSGSGNCATSYYTYQNPLNLGVPTLNDVFAGKARIQDVSESQPVSLHFNPSDVTHVWGQKLSILSNKDYLPGQSGSYKYYAFTRGYNENTTRVKGLPYWSYNMYLMASNDGISFEQIGKVFEQSVIEELGSMYDAKVSIDYSVCPNKYVMALEGSGQMYVSFSTTPFVPLSWSKPVKIVEAADNKSASTGIFLIDGTNKYASWTVVDDVPTVGAKSQYSKGISVSDFSTFLGNSSIGSILLPAEANTHCTSGWDCNNKDKEDWVKEGDWYYLLYAGGNYFGCERPTGDSGTNIWGLGMARSRNALSGYEGGYLQIPGKGLGEIFKSSITNTCAMEYPIMVNMDGELYMYYSSYSTPQDRTPTNNNDVHRSKIVWIAASPVPSPSPSSSPAGSPTPLPSPTISPSPSSSPSPSPRISPTPTLSPSPSINPKAQILQKYDLNNDRDINSFDFAILLSKWGLTGTNNADLNNDGIVNSFDYSILKNQLNLFRANP